MGAAAACAVGRCRDGTRRDRHTGEARVARRREDAGASRRREMRTVHPVGGTTRRAAETDVEVGTDRDAAAGDRRRTVRRTDRARSAGDRGEGGGPVDHERTGVAVEPVSQQVRLREGDLGRRERDGRRERATHRRRAAVVGRTIAVFVDAVGADLGRGLHALHAALDIAVAGGEAGRADARETGAADDARSAALTASTHRRVVRRTVAVLVDAVAGDLGRGLHVLGAGEDVVATADIGTRGADAEETRTAGGAVLAGAGECAAHAGETFVVVDLTVAVLVHVVVEIADLVDVAVDGDVVVVAVERVGHARHPVDGLATRDVHLGDGRIRAVTLAVTVLVLVAGEEVLADVHLVDAAHAVVVDAVAQLTCRRVDGGVGVVAVTVQADVDPLCGRRQRRAGGRTADGGVPDVDRRTDAIGVAVGRAEAVVVRAARGDGDPVHDGRVGDSVAVFVDRSLTREGAGFGLRRERCEGRRGVGEDLRIRRAHDGARRTVAGIEAGRVARGTLRAGSACVVDRRVRRARQRRAGEDALAEQDARRVDVLPTEQVVGLRGGGVVQGAEEPPRVGDATIGGDASVAGGRRDVRQVFAARALRDHEGAVGVGRAGRGRIPRGAHGRSGEVAAILRLTRHAGVSGTERTERRESRGVVRTAAGEAAEGEDADQGQGHQPDAHGVRVPFHTLPPC